MEIQDTTPQDSQPKSIPRLNGLNLLKRWNGLSQRTKLLIIASPTALWLIGQLGSLFIQPPENIAQSDPTGYRDTILATSPLVMSGVSPEMPMLEKAQRFQTVLPTYESALADKSEAIATELIIKEAKRLRETAMAELDLFGIPQDDDYYSFSMVQCGQRMPDVQCVLLRYQGDGIRMMAEGEKLGDAYAYFQGYIRAQAATLALFPLNTVEAGEPPIQSWLYYREGIAATLPALPNTAIIGVQLGAEDMKASPVQHLIRSNPLPGMEGE